VGRIEDKKKNRLNRRRRIRSKVHGTAERPRLSIFRSTRHIYAQIVDDDMGAVITSASTMEAQLRESVKYGGNIDAAREVGKLLAERAATKKIEAVSFDRGGFKYHGRVKALAEAVRDGGLKF
jgi:large subunit ribosomal protein L18